MVNKLHLILLSAFFTSPAFSGYALLSPPPSYVVNSAGTVGRIAVGTAANAPIVSGGYVMTSATLNLGARSVTVPVGLRIAANASVFAATRLNPYATTLKLAIEAYPYLKEWFQNAKANLMIDDDGVIYVKSNDLSQSINPDGTYQYHPDLLFTNGQKMADVIPEYHKDLCNFSTYDALSSDNACSTYVLAHHKVIHDATLGRNVRSCLPGAMFIAYVTVTCFPKSGGNVQFASQTTTNQPASELDIAPLAQTAVNPKLLPYISDDIEVELAPVINPATFPSADVLIGPQVNPAPILQPAPFRVPNGEPIPIPNSNQYQQPWHEITPAPTPDQPWRVQIISVTTVVESPVSVRQPEPVPPSPTDCDKYPDSLGCISVDVPDDDAIPELQKQITLQSGPSFSAGATCPPDLIINFQGHTFSAPMSTPCSWLLMARPVILLLAALTAVAIVRPGGGPRNAKTSV